MVTFWIALILLLGLFLSSTSRWRATIPFLMMAVYFGHQYGLEKQYNFGFDDAFYFSYLPSVWIDHDLDFTNQYKETHFPADIFTRQTPTGALKNEFPIGPALCWSPFFILADGITMLSGMPRTGYGPLYVNFCIVGNIVLCFLGLYMIFGWIASFYRPLIAGTSAAVAWAATSIYVYSTRIFLVSETVSMFSVALLVFLTLKSDRKKTYVAVFVGLAGALTVLVRFHNALFLLAPLLFWTRDAVHSRNWAAFGRRLLCFSLGFACGLCPQMLVWKLLYGTWFVNTGQYLLWWRNPLVLEVLFSARKGLFVWTPLAFFSLLGLGFFWRASRFWCVVFLLIFAGNIYVNAAQWDWWGSTAFGARRFSNCLIIFAAGLAAILEFFTRKKVVVAVPVWLFIGSLVGLNFLLTRSYRRGKLQYDHADRMSEVVGISPYNLLLPLINAMEFPIQFEYHHKYGMDLYHPESEFFIGEDILYFQQRHGNLVAGQANPVFGSGWDRNESAFKGRIVRVCRTSDCSLILPLFFKYDTDLTAELILGGPGKGSQNVDFLLNGEMVFSKMVHGEQTTVILPFYKWDFQKRMNNLTLHIRPLVSTSIPQETFLYSLQFRATEFRRPQAITQ